jgi:hypothetical protein
LVYWAVNPSWNTHVYNALQQFEDPVIYTPGDNEWADCHKSKQFLSGAPLSELDNIRELFFAKPGRSLGLTEKIVTSQAIAYSNMMDKKFVENVMWQDNHIVFSTFNQPGGSNDNDEVAAPWTAPFTNSTAQRAERIEREAANLRWLNATFALAQQNAKAVVIMTQADMWDTEKYPIPGLSNHGPFVQLLAANSLVFNKPVLVLNGDSHTFKVDSPLVSNGATGPFAPNCDTSVVIARCDLSKIHNTPAVPKLRRIVVQGSGETAPLYWTKLTINSNANNIADVFTYTNVCYSGCI